MILTFAVVGVAWRTPKFDPAKPGRPCRRGDPCCGLPILRGSSPQRARCHHLGWRRSDLGPAECGQRIARIVLYVLLWVGLVAVSVLVGPIWRVISPVRTVWRLLRRVRTAEPRRYPPRLGYWPAVAGLFASSGWNWPAGSRLTDRDQGWILVYAVMMFCGAALFRVPVVRPSGPFEVYSVTVSRLAPLRRNRETGRIVVGNPLDHLPTMPVRPEPWR